MREPSFSPVSQGAAASFARGSRALASGPRTCSRTRSRVSTAARSTASANRRASALASSRLLRRVSSSAVAGSAGPLWLWNCRPQARSQTQGATRGSRRRSAPSTLTRSGPRISSSAPLQIPAITSPMTSSTGPSAAIRASSSTSPAPSSSAMRPGALRGGLGPAGGSASRAVGAGLHPAPALARSAVGDISVRSLPRSTPSPAAGSGIQYPDSGSSASRFRCLP